MRASVNLAAASQKIAEDALRDSTAMKTIAVMTLIFLPATFLCVRIQTIQSNTTRSVLANIPCLYSRSSV
jgi:hypothetical protein